MIALALLFSVPFLYVAAVAISETSLSWRQRIFDSGFVLTILAALLAAGAAFGTSA